MFWMITRDVLSNDGADFPNQAGTWGKVGRGCCIFKDGAAITATRENQIECPISPLSNGMIRFRITDDDGEVYYEGVMTAELADAGEAVLAPLDDFADPNAGATTLQLWNGENWKNVN